MNFNNSFVFSFVCVLNKWNVKQIMIYVLHLEYLYTFQNAKYYINYFINSC